MTGNTNPSLLSSAWRLCLQYPILLVIGALTGFLWANLAPESYGAIHHLVLWDNALIGQPSYRSDGTLMRTLSLHFLVNDGLMALFFALATKEIFEALVLPGGSLRGRQCFVPMFAAIGGMLGPALVYLVGMTVMHLSTGAPVSHLLSGAAIPTATDIAFCYLVARLIFGTSHPAVTFLLLLAIIDDALGLLIIAMFFPKTAIAPLWILGSLAVAVAVYLVANYLPQRLAATGRGDAYRSLLRRLGLLPFVLAGVVSWYCFQLSGLHPALGLIPIIPTLPHAQTDLGLFAEGEENRHDLLSRFEHYLKPVVEVILFCFGFLNAGVQLSALSGVTAFVFLGLLIGKPLGILSATYASTRWLRLPMPGGLSFSEMVVVGFAAAIGFTVALFMATVALPPGTDQEAARMGALLSLGCAVPAFVAAKLLRIKRR